MSLLFDQQVFNYTAEEFKTWSLWLCPLQQSQSPIIHPHIAKAEADVKNLKPMLYNSLWGPGPAKHDVFVKANQQLYHRLREPDVMKWLYAKTYYTKKEFWLN